MVIDGNVVAFSIYQIFLNASFVGFVKESVDIASVKPAFPSETFVVKVDGAHDGVRVVAVRRPHARHGHRRGCLLTKIATAKERGQWVRGSKRTWTCFILGWFKLLNVYDKLGVPKKLSFDLFSIIETTWNWDFSVIRITDKELSLSKFWRHLVNVIVVKIRHSNSHINYMNQKKKKLFL